MAGEREVAQAFEAQGWHVRGLEGGGDHFCVLSHTRDYTVNEADTVGTVTHRLSTLHVEVKRQERLRLPEWLEQARAEAPPGVPPVVVFRQNKGRWYACLLLEDLLDLIG